MIERTFLAEGVATAKALRWEIVQIFKGHAGGPIKQEDGEQGGEPSKVRISIAILQGGKPLKLTAPQWRD